MALDADTCRGCGQPLSESTLPEDQVSYEVPDPVRCHSCTARHLHEQKYAESPPGLYFETHRRR